MYVHVHVHTRMIERAIRVYCLAKLMPSLISRPLVSARKGIVFICDSGKAPEKVNRFKIKQSV